MIHIISLSFYLSDPTLSGLKLVWSTKTELKLFRWDRPADVGNGRFQHGGDVQVDRPDQFRNQNSAGEKGSVIR
jgi:hypothetical protein